MSIKNILRKLNSRNISLIPRFSKFSKTIIFSFVVVSVIFLTKNILAADNIVKQKQDAIKDGNNQESWLNEAAGSNLVTFQEMIGGTIPDSVLNGETDPDTGYPVSFLPGGLLGHTSTLVASVFNSPASGIDYIAQVKDDFFGKPVYAQSTGFSSLNPLLPLWKTFRDTSYTIFALIFISIGIMIMLRVKISPQAVISIQNSIPKIVVSLILVTFSYAIAGLCIDLINFFLAFMLNLLFSTTKTSLSSNLFDLGGTGDLSITRLINTIRDWCGNNAFNFQNLNNSGFLTMISMLNRMAPNSAILVLGGFLGGALGGFIGGLATGVVGLTLGSVLLVVIIEIILIVNIFKFLFGAIKCYITIILRIIFAPLEISLGALPNSKMGFSSWLKELIGNLAVFPISILFLAIVNLIMDFSSNNLWAPTIIGETGTKFFLPTMIGIGGVLLFAKLPDLIPEIIFNIKPSPWGKAIGESWKNLPFKQAASSVVKEAGLSAAGKVTTGISKGIKIENRDSLAERATKEAPGSDDSIKSTKKGAKK